MASPTPVLASIDGAVSAAAEATVPAADDGLLRGDGVFEVIRLYAGKPFALEDHLDRIERSGAAIELPVDRGAVAAEIEALLAQDPGFEGQLRIVLTRAGRRVLFTERLPERGETVALASVTFAPSVILTGAKTLSYAANMQATRLAQRKGADEAVLVLPDGVLLEAPTSTVFWAGADGALKTPSIDSGILESITRARIVRELDVEQGRFAAEDLRGAHEAFLASTTREVQPVSAVDGAELAAVPGPRTLEARETFDRVIEAEL